MYNYYIEPVHQWFSSPKWHIMARKQGKAHKVATFYDLYSATIALIAIIESESTLKSLKAA